MVGNGIEGGGLANAGVVTPKSVAQDYRAGRDAVGIFVAGIAPNEVQHSLQQGRGVMETPAACPSVRSREDGSIPMLPADPIDFARDKTDGFRPRERHEAVATAPLAVRKATGALRFQPALPHHGLQHS